MSHSDKNGACRLLPSQGGGSDQRLRLLNDRDSICVPHLREGKGSFRIFTEGDDLYDAMIAAINGARKDIRLESFIFAADEVGGRFAKALADRARAGVDVRFHFDSRGSLTAPSTRLYQELINAGVQLKWYHPWSWRHPSRYFQRDHRKILVVDEQEVFLGGFNIRLENSRVLYGEGRQRDTHVGVQGELARKAAMLFDRLWNHTDDPHVNAIPEDTSEVEALLVPNSSRRCQQRLACLHAGLISGSQSYVYLTTPFFCPDTMIGTAMRAAARRGVDVRLLVPRNSDPPFAGWATRAAYEPLLKAGVRIFEYLPRKLHAKTSVIDGWAIIGSANLDHLSLFVNRELVLIAKNPGLREELRDAYMRDLKDAAEVSLAVWMKRGWSEQFLEGIGRAGRRVL